MLLILALVLTTQAMGVTAQTPEVRSEGVTLAPQSDGATIIEERLGSGWVLVAEGIDMAREENIEQVGTIWGGPAGDRLEVIEISVLDQSPAAISEAWEAAQDIYAQQRLVDHESIDRVEPDLPCLDMEWGSRDDASAPGTAVSGFRTVGVLCATSSADFSIVLYSSFQGDYDAQFAYVGLILQGA